MLKRLRRPGLAIDNNCAVAFTDDGFRVLSTRRRARAYALSVQDGEVIQRRLSRSSQYLPVESAPPGVTPVTSISISGLSDHKRL